jgi:hypothetical protein
VNGSVSPALDSLDVQNLMTVGEAVNRLKGETIRKVPDAEIGQRGGRVNAATSMAKETAKDLAVSRCSKFWHLTQIIYDTCVNTTFIGRASCKP